MKGIYPSVDGDLINMHGDNSLDPIGVLVPVEAHKL